MKILLCAATNGEIRSTIDWLNAGNDKGDHQVTVLITGVGTMAATYSLCEAVLTRTYDLVIGAGVAGAFDESISIGECVIVAQESNGDLGAEDHESFLDVIDIGLQQADDPPYLNAALPNPMLGIPFDTEQLRKVSAITVNTVSGCEKTIEQRRSRYQAQIESMEGAALHYVCLKRGLPFLQLRAISNYVTPRDRGAWRMEDAVAALNAQLVRWLGESAASETSLRGT